MRVLVAHSGGPTPVMNASLAGIIDECNRRGHEIYGARRGILGIIQGEIVRLNNVFPGELEKIPGSYLISCRYRVSRENAHMIIEALKKMKIDLFLYIGGNDSMLSALALSREAEKEGIRVNGIPKTVDNDLRDTYYSPGYPSAAYFVAHATIATSLHIKSLSGTYGLEILEVGGRDSGWLAVASYLASKEHWPDAVLVPEIPVDVEKLMEYLKEIIRKKGHAMITVAEGIKDKEGNDFSIYAGKDSFGHPYRTGTGLILTRMAYQILSRPIRYTRVGGLPTTWGSISVDRKIAKELGHEAIRRNDLHGVMFSITEDLAINTAPLENVAGKVRKLDFLDGQEINIENYRKYMKTITGQEYMALANSLSPLAP